MELTLTTPSIIYPTVSLLMLAYTQRFLSLANLIRSLHKSYQEAPQPMIRAQIDNLRFRVRLIRNMQALGVMSMLMCTLCLFLLFTGHQHAGAITFGISLILLITSLALSLLEIQNSVRALDLHLHDLEQAP